jgi:ornithine cyclodeaminase/alanine dehydrogenase-like protein (mu-crystallin family)
MSGPVLALSADEAWTAFELIDPIAPLVEELAGRTEQRTGALSRWTGDPVPAEPGELVVLHDDDASCVLPAASLRMFHSASLVAVAARELLVPGGITVALLGVTPATQPQLAAVTRHVPDISHVAICHAGDLRSSPLEPRLVDLLEHRGIQLSAGTVAADAVFGANLVVVFPDGVDLTPLRIGTLARGAVLVNASGRTMPAELATDLDEVYVDDMRLVDQRGHHHRKAIADLGELLSGSHPGRQDIDDVLAVELLGVDVLNVRLARQLHRAARRHGLGAHLDV